MGIVVSAEVDRTAATNLYGLSAERLDQRDTLQRPVARWFAYEDGVAVGLATAFVRPDRRIFVAHRLISEPAYEPLLERAVDDIVQAVHVTLDRDRPDRIRSAIALGFEPEVDSTTFAVPFDSAIEQAARVRRSTRFELLGAEHVDRDALFELDTDLRRDIPGSNGWRGDRSWFDEELKSPEYDPATYLVAVDPNGRGLVGLVRFWRNESGPRLGLLGVRLQHRSGAAAIALAGAGLIAASEWGSKTFSTHTARRSLQRRLRKIGAIETGGFVQMKST